MKDWARTAEDKLFIPKEVFTSPAEGETSVAVCFYGSICLSLREHSATEDSSHSYINSSKKQMPPAVVGAVIA